MPGTITYADWSVSWSIPSLNGQGLVLQRIKFQGKSVLHRAEQPFALVPYHGDSPTFKEGLNPKCGGRGYRALRPTAPNANDDDLPSDSYATNDNRYNRTTNQNGAVVVEQHAGTSLAPAKLIIWSKFQVGNYQYIHHWEFWADGTIHPSTGVGGRLYRDNDDGGAHFHHFYYRLDFDLITPENNRAQRFGHTGNNVGDDSWQDILTESKDTFDPNTTIRWRVIHTTPKPNGKFPSYELIPYVESGPDGTYSTGDFWVVQYKENESGARIETGSDVDCTDEVLSTQYVNGESVDGEDLVVWYCNRYHHHPRSQGEERDVTPYKFFGFHIEPRDFLDDTPQRIYNTVPPSP